MKRSLLLVMLLCLACSVVFAQATRPRSSRIVTGTAFPYGTCEVGDEWVDTSISPAQTRNCLTAGTWSTVAVLSPDGSSSNTINGSAQTVQIALSGFRGVGVTITGTWSGTLVAEMSLDAGSTWITAQFYDPVAKTFSSSTTANITSSIVVTGGASHIRIRSSAWTSGTATITLRATEASTPVIDGSLNTQPISAASLPLPSGAATSANQTNGSQQSQITKAVSASATLQSAATGNGDGTDFLVDGYAGLAVTVNCDLCGSGTTVNFKASEDGTNFTSIHGMKVGTTNAATSATEAGVTVWRFEIAGFKKFRASISGYAAGTVTVTATALLSPFSVNVSPENVDNVSSGTITGAGTSQAVVIKTDGYQGVGVAVNGSYTGTLICDVAFGSPNNWAGWGRFFSPNTGLFSSLNSSVFEGLIETYGGVSAVRVYATSFTSGSVDVVLRATRTGPNVVVIGAPISLPNDASTATNQTSGSQKTKILDGSGSVIGSSNQSLNVNVNRVGDSGVAMAVPGSLLVGVTGNTGAGFDASVTAASAPSNQIVTGAVFRNTKPTLSSGQSHSLLMDSKGNLLGVVRDAAGNDRGANVNSSNQLSVSVDNANVSSNVAQINGVTPLMGNGTAGTGSPRVTVASDNTPFAVKIDQTTHGTTDQVAADLAKVGGSTVSTAAAGVQKVGVVGNSGATVDAAIGAATAPTNQIVTGGVFNSTKPTLTNGQSAAVQLDSKGNQLGVIRDAAGNDRGANVNSSSQLSVSVDNTPNVAVTSVPSNQSVNVAQVAGATVAIGNGTASGTPRVTIASDSTGTVAATQSGTWTVQPGNTANTTAWLVQPVPGTANGASTCVVQSAASTNATNCKNAAGLIYGLEVVNTTSTIYYLRLYNLSTSPTCSSAAGFVRTVPIPHSSGAGAGIANFYTVGETYGTGIGFCLTAGGSSTDNSNAATGVYVTIHYK